ncbi:hypothetical protein T484DRAFT_1805664 [Baffinella frigidus]|nr:hypothetical protein T484DRAFT_1805664 [Cryptophyta sp. CCMP2293]
MAYRAYRWAYQCLTHPDFSLLRGKSLHDGLMTNLGALNYAMSNPTEAAFSNREGLRQQNEEHRNFIRNKSGAKPPVAPSSEACAGCGASGGHNLLNCACKRVKYCGKACQEAAWAAHKKDCKRWRKHP